MWTTNVIALAFGLPSSQMVGRPRFVVDSADDLVSAAQRAEPPLQLGERAEIHRGDRIVVLELRKLAPHAEWVEITT